MFIVSHPYAAVSLEFTNVLFYFSGFIALAVFISNLLFCRGSVCGAARADVAFGAFEFCLWGASAVLNGREIFKGGFRRPGGLKMGGSSSSAPQSGPQMKEAQLA